jgi:hypothetical protein
MKPAVIPSGSGPWQIKDVPLEGVANCVSVAAGCIRISRARGNGWRTGSRLVPLAVVACPISLGFELQFVKVTSFRFAVRVIA